MDKRCKIDWEKWDRSLGSMSDNRLAEKIGCGTLTVMQRRAKLHLPSWSSKNKAAMAARIRPSIVMPLLAVGLAAIYRIVNMTTSDEYIGMTAQLPQRMNDHARGLADGNHPNALIREAVKKYGVSAFTIDLLEVCENSAAPDRERHWINIRKPKYNNLPENT